MADTEVYAAITRADGSVVHVAVQLVGRFPTAPNRFWQLLDDDLWSRLKLLVLKLKGRPPWATYGREPTDEAINYECMRLDYAWTNRFDEYGQPLPPEPGMVSWRRISDAEHQMFNQDRIYRDALEDAGGKIQHNMTKAKELHRAHLRHVNGDKFMALDRQWVDAMAANKRPEADAVEAKRKAMRDRVNDPAIDAAKTIEELKAVTPIEG
jgi:hypothetical protein